MQTLPGDSSDPCRLTRLAVAGCLLALAALAASDPVRAARPAGQAQVAQPGPRPAVRAAHARHGRSAALRSRQPHAPQAMQPERLRTARTARPERLRTTRAVTPGHPRTAQAVTSGHPRAARAVTSEHLRAAAGPQPGRQRVAAPARDSRPTEARLRLPVGRSAEAGQHARLGPSMDPRQRVQTGPSADTRQHARTGHPTDTRQHVRAGPSTETARLATHIAQKWRMPLPRAQRIVRAAYSQARAQHLPPTLILAVVAQESSFRPAAQSHRGAQGLMQVIARHHPEKVKGLRGDALLKPETNIQVGTQVLAEYLERDGGRLDPALRRYSGNATAYPSRVRAVWTDLERVRNSDRDGI